MDETVDRDIVCNKFCWRRREVVCLRNYCREQLISVFEVQADRSVPKVGGIWAGNWEVFSWWFRYDPVPAIVVVKSVVSSSSSSTSFPSTNQAIKTLLVSLKALVIVLLGIDLSSLESNQGQHIVVMTFTSKMQMH